MDLSLYQKMIGNGNSSISQAYINDTIVHVNGIFDKSPSFKKIQINNMLTDAIVSHTKKSTVLNLLFRPNTVLNKGLYALIDADTYMITEFVPNQIYPKANVQLCNASLKWKDSLGAIKEYKCIVGGKTYDEDDTEERVVTSNAKLEVLVQYNADTKTIKPTQRFVLGEHAYEVESIDALSSVHNGEGILKLDIKYTSSTSTDDKTNQVADSSGNSGWSGWQ